MDYNRMVDDALKGVVRQAIAQAASQGLQGEHHFYLTFKTGLPGVVMPDYLRERFNEEMTIVLQHQFWDLAVDEEKISVTLSFSGKPEKLVIPFEALSGFFDPSVQFGLQFKSEEDLSDDVAADDFESDLSEEQPAEAGDAGETSSESAASSESEDGDNVVTLDAFRRK